MQYSRFKDWGEKDPLRTPEDLVFSVARFFQTGGSLNNYYMYYGGTNFGRTAGGPYIATSYDYNAPLNEYGLPNEPKYSHLKKLHESILSAESFLTLPPESTRNITINITLTTYSHNCERFCILSNIDESNDTVVDIGSGNFSVPAWSVSFLNGGCTNEIYNTAKVNDELIWFEPNCFEVALYTGFEGISMPEKCRWEYGYSTVG